MRFFWRPIYILCLCVGLVVCQAGYVVFSQQRFLDDDTVLTNTESDVIGSEISDIDDPLRAGALGAVRDVEGIYVNEDLYETHDTGIARERITNYVKGGINYALGIIGLIAMLYLLYHGFLIFTAGGDDEKSKKGLQGVKYAFFALAGLGLAWFVLSLVFRLLQYLTNN